MNYKVFISCAVTGSGDTASKHPDLPKTPEQIATASIEAAKAGAAIAHNMQHSCVHCNLSTLF